MEGGDGGALNALNWKDWRKKVLINLKDAHIWFSLLQNQHDGDNKAHYFSAATYDFL